MPDSNITKRALAQTMKDLMAERPFAKISVGDICERCGMNRKSFYSATSTIWSTGSSRRSLSKPSI